MADLEKFVNDHLEEFGSFEPAPGHFKRFEDRLQSMPDLAPAVRNRSTLLKIAAVIIMLIAVSVFVFDFATREIREKFSAAGEGKELPAEIREAIQYYDNQTSAQLATFNKLTAANHDAGALNASAIRNLQSIDASTEELKNTLSQNPGNEQILDAIVRNQQMKAAMLNTMITQLSPRK
ncbi:MAG: hypothetical protein WCJ26_01500 [bacterium]